MKICFWGTVANALLGKTPGGGELQISLLAKTLAKFGHEVVVIDYEISEAFTTMDGVKVIPVKGWNKGIRIIRNITHRFPQLYKTLKNQNADIYYCRIRDFRHIIVYWAARKIKAKFILGLADGMDSINFFKRCKYKYFTNIGTGGLWWFFDIIFTEITHPILLRKSDIVLSQHEDQARTLRNKNIHTVIQPNLIDLNEFPKVINPERHDFTFVASLSKNKGFDKIYEIIVKCPDHTFKVIGQPRDKTGHIYFKKLQVLKNVKLFGRLDHENTLLQMINSKALINTSPVEGFPNIFLEAWACGIPVLSLYVNPGNVIEKYKLGRFANGDIEKLIEFMSNDLFDKDFSVRAYDYLNQYHIINESRIKIVGEFFNNHKF